MKPPFKLDDVKTVKCKECGIDVVINAMYPIESVNCQPWYCPKNQLSSKDLSLE